MKPRTISEKRSEGAPRSTVLRWGIFGFIGVLLLGIIFLRVYWWQKRVSNPGKSSPGQPSSLISPLERSRIDQFRDLLNALSKSDLNTIEQGESYLKEKLLSLSSRGKDMAFMVFYDYYYQTISEYNERVMGSDDLLRVRLDVGNSRGLTNEAYLNYLNDPRVSKPDPQIQTLMELLWKNGLRLLMIKDEYSIGERPGYLADHFGAVLSDALRAFLELQRDDARLEIFSPGGALLISYRDLGERVILWERYLDKYPDSLVADEANYFYHNYLNTMLFGITDTSQENGVAQNLDSSNTGIFDERGVLKTNLKQVYYNFKSKYANTKSGKLIDQFYEILLHNKFKKSRQVEEFYQEYQINTGRE